METNLITISFQFNSVEEAHEFLATQGRRRPQAEQPAEQPVVDGSKKERKPRSDAGQPRGPYKRRDETPAEPAAAAPATQTPAETPPAVPEAAAAPAAPEAPKELTLLDVRAAMTGRSTEKNIALLKKFGVAKSSELPVTSYADFIAACKRGE